jgi:hypothetical protein
MLQVITTLFHYHLEPIFDGMPKMVFKDPESYETNVRGSIGWKTISKQLLSF